MEFLTFSATSWAPLSYNERHDSPIDTLADLLFDAPGAPLELRAPDGSDETVANDEEQIRTIIRDWERAVQAQDMDQVLARHSADMQIFDVPEPIQAREIPEYRETGGSSFTSTTRRRGRTRATQGNEPVRSA